MGDPEAGAALEARVARAVERLRPALRLDGNDIELLEVAGADAVIRLAGACRGWPGAAAALREGVEGMLREAVPELGMLVAVD